MSNSIKFIVLEAFQLPVWANILVAIAGVAGAILTIWALFSKLKSTLEESVRSEIESNNIKTHKAAEEYLKLQNDTIEKHFNYKLDCFEKRMEELVGDILKDKHENDIQHHLIRESLVESYKRDFRQTYYKLKETGYIEDHEKSYIDKIMPLYVAIGGNSDIAAKYEEIKAVYVKQILDEAKKKKQKKEKISGDKE